MKFSFCISLLLLSSYFVAFAIGLEEANRLRHMMKSQAFSSSKVNAKYVHDNVYVDATQKGMMEQDRILALPGQPKGVNFDQFGGYVTVDPKAGRTLFYYFVEATQNASSKPLVLWLNGGPGCSSLGGGGMLELGPFFVNRDGKTLYRNEYSWNNEANMLFLESPAGVGYSYSNRSSDYDETGDKSTTDDSYTFLVNWIERFPTYKGRDFYITGESYGGHYVPELASKIIASNKGSKSNLINLKGIASKKMAGSIICMSHFPGKGKERRQVNNKFGELLTNIRDISPPKLQAIPLIEIQIGNAYLDADTNLRATYDYLHSHALISQETHKEIERLCSFVEGSYTTSCRDALSSADKEVGGIDLYNIYAPLCQGSSNSSNFDAFVNHGDDPCADRYLYSYLNLPEVQMALHANTTRLGYPWSDCSTLVGSGYWTDAPRSVLPIIKELIDGGLRVWLYSGDVDTVVPVPSTLYSLDILNLPIQTPWRAWNVTNQVGGYVIGYKGLTFATVRGAGHMVPRYQPQRSLVLFKSFLDGQLPPP